MNREARAGRPENWPTHIGSGAFWEELGRTVAALGMLEDTLASALIVLSGQRPAADDHNAEEQVQEWYREVAEYLSGALHPLANSLAAAWEERDGALSEEQRTICDEIRSLAKERNRLCHGAWTAFDQPDTGTVRFFERRQEFAGRHTARRSMESMARTRGRAAMVIAELVADIEARTGEPFPGRRR